MKDIAVSGCRIVFEAGETGLLYATSPEAAYVAMAVEAEAERRREDVARRERKARRLRAAWYGRRSLFHGRPLWRSQ